MNGICIVFAYYICIIFYKYNYKITFFYDLYKNQPIKRQKS